MSSILEAGNNKAKCQKFTPDTLVETMLDLAGYTSNLMGKTILENSFGAGNILKFIVIRYINSAINEGRNGEAIKKIGDSPKMCWLLVSLCGPFFRTLCTVR